MMPTCVSPKLSACASWTIARTASGGSCAVIAQRAAALSAAITTSIDGCRVNRGDSANSTISAITPRTHRVAIVIPSYPACCQAIDAKM
jgi:hypothetical protein